MGSVISPSKWYFWKGWDLWVWGVVFFNNPKNTGEKSHLYNTNQWICQSWFDMSTFICTAKLHMSSAKMIYTDGGCKSFITLKISTLVASFDYQLCCLCLTNISLLLLHRHCPVEWINVTINSTSCCRSKKNGETIFFWNFKCSFFCFS